MLKVYSEGLDSFEAWSGAVSLWNEIQDSDLVNDFEMLLEECYPDGITETQINDILWFDGEWVRECLGMKSEEEEEWHEDLCQGRF